jgi:hypothetical protein
VAAGLRSQDITLGGLSVLLFGLGVVVAPSVGSDQAARSAAVAGFAAAGVHPNVHIVRSAQYGPCALVELTWAEHEFEFVALARQGDDWVYRGPVRDRHDMDDVHTESDCLDALASAQAG